MLRPPSEGGRYGTHSRALPLLSKGSRYQGRKDQDRKTALPRPKCGLFSRFFCAQNQSDITYMTQTHTRMICPKGPATFACTLSGDLGALIITARHMRHEMLQRLLFDRFPRTSDGKAKAPPACRIRFVPVLDRPHVGLGAVGSISPHNDQLRPTRRDRLTYHLAKQGICTPIP